MNISDRFHKQWKLGISKSVHFPQIKIMKIKISLKGKAHHPVNAADLCSDTPVIVTQRSNEKNNMTSTNQTYGTNKGQSQVGNVCTISQN